MPLTLSSKNSGSTTFTCASGWPLYASFTHCFMWTATIKKNVVDDFQLEMKDCFEMAAQVRWRVFCLTSRFRIGKPLRLTKHGVTRWYALCLWPPSCAEGGIVGGRYSGVLMVGGIDGMCIVVLWWYVPPLPMTRCLV